MLVLVIEDNYVAREGIKLSLQANSFDVLAFKSAEEALLKLISNKLSPDLIILDLKLNKLSGEEFIQSLEKLNKNIPIIVITGFDALAEEAQKSKNVVKILKKPINLAQLIEIVKSLKT